MALIRPPCCAVSLQYYHTESVIKRIGPDASSMACVYVSRKMFRTVVPSLLTEKQVSVEVRKSAGSQLQSLQMHCVSVVTVQCSFFRYGADLVTIGQLCARARLAMLQRFATLCSPHMLMTACPLLRYRTANTLVVLWWAWRS